MSSFVITLPEMRQLATTKQHLSAKDTPPMLDVIRNLGCLQLDPISAVERSHLLVLWSRLGVYDVAEIDKLIYEDKALFEYWAHVASIVLTEHYPVHQYRMERYPSNQGTVWQQRVTDWLAEVDGEEKRLTNMILSELRENGPMSSSDFEHDGRASEPSVWSSGRHVNRMLTHMWTKGEILVAKRKGKIRYWDLAERCLPDWTPRESLSDDEMTYRAAQRAVRALGAATAKQIKIHYTRNRYPNLQANLNKLVKDQLLLPVDIEGQSGQWYMHTEDIPLLEDIRAGGFQPRTTLLSPFDNLICDRDRTHALWDFFFRIEIYVPKAKREYGYYVLPILHGDDLIGRIDPRYDRKTKTLNIQNIYSEDSAPKSKSTVNAIAKSIKSLAKFLGAETVIVDNVPTQWAAIKTKF